MWSGKPLDLFRNYVRSETLKRRLDALGWSYYELARRVAELRTNIYGDEIKSFKSLTTAMQKAIEAPHTATGKTLDTIIMAMGGELYVRWETEKVIIETTEEGLSSNTQDQHPERKQNPEKL